MSFEYNPADEDEHALCRQEIETLRAVNAELLAACEKAMKEFEQLSQALGEQFPPETVEVWNQIDAAISKAIST